MLQNQLVNNLFNISGKKTVCKEQEVSSKIKSPDLHTPHRKKHIATSQEKEGTPGETTEFLSFPELNTVLERNHISNEIKEILNSFETNCKSINFKKGIYIYGSPGSGKTRFIIDLLTSLNYDIIKYDAGDVRNKTLIDTITSNNISNCNVLQLMNGNIKKIAILMDEIDGMNNGDKGGITSLIKLIRQKKTKKQKTEHITLNPIICIGNYYVDKKIKELMKVCNVFELKTPTNEQMETIIQRTIPISLSPSLKTHILNYIQGDLVKLKFVINLYRKKPELLNEEILSAIFVIKSYNYDAKKITHTLINTPVPLEQHSSFMNETDRTIVSLLYHENIIDVFSETPSLVDTGLVQQEVNAPSSQEPIFFTIKETQNLTQKMGGKVTKRNKGLVTAKKVEKKSGSKKSVVLTQPLIKTVEPDFNPVPNLTPTLDPNSVLNPTLALAPTDTLIPAKGISRCFNVREGASGETVGFPEFYLKVLDNICYADYIDRITFQNQIWVFNEMSSLIKTFYNNYIYHKTFPTKQGKFQPDEVRFTKVLTKYSTEYNNQLFIYNFCQELNMDKRDMKAFFKELRLLYGKSFYNQTDKLNQVMEMFETLNISKLDVKRIYRFLDKNVKFTEPSLNDVDDEDDEMEVE
jgi:DNA replication protein DnaC